jgi:hypothetical protein
LHASQLAPWKPAAHDVHSPLPERPSSHVPFTHVQAWQFAPKRPDAQVSQLVPPQPALHELQVPSPERPWLHVPCRQVQGAQLPPKYPAAHESQFAPVQFEAHVSQFVPVQPVPAAQELHFPSPLCPSLQAPCAQEQARQFAP